MFLHFVHAQGVESAAAARHERGENMAKSLQQAIRGHVSVDSKNIMLRDFLEPADTDGTATARGLFFWRKGEGINWQTNLAESTVSTLGPDMKWRANLKKGFSASRGWFPAADGEMSVIWARMGNNEVAGIVADVHDIPNGPNPTILFAAGTCLVALLFCALAAGGWLLARAAHRAREESARKATFIDNLSHELKMPLAVVRLKIERLLSGRVSDPEKLQTVYRTIADENNEMIRQIDALLDLVRAGKRTRRYASVTFDLASVVREVGTSMAERFPNDGLSVTAEGPVTVRADIGAVRQIIRNLLDNAAKYAADGGPVSVRLSHADGYASVEVADRGKGIPADLRERVFERFYRIDDELTRSTGGTGIGLSLARCFARDMGGDVTVSERNGGGCIFLLQLPEESNG